MSANRSDPSLIQACLDGRSWAWDALVEKYGRLVYSVLYRNRLSTADAEDVFQNVFLILYRNLEQLKDQTRLSAWLITTAHRECWRLGRRARKNTVNIDDSDVQQPEPSEDELEALERQHILNEGLTKLGGQCESLLRALFLDPEQPSYETIAQNLGMRVGSIGPTRARCFARLQGILTELGLNDACPASH